MNPERWQQVRAIFEHAEGLSDSARQDFLDIECAGDFELRDEVQSLLDSADQADNLFLNTPAGDILGDSFEMEQAPSRIGCRMGAYRIVDVIGRGGMGEVFRAVRDDGQYEKLVAIKLVRVGMDSAYLLQRFRHERQILASLDHPNIARLLDGGTTEQGIPYLVMELIEGVPIDEYCRTQNLSITERLRLFQDACAAVQFAHQRLIIHRDIKPGNILVTAEGELKLLDFGVAKILDANQGEATAIRPMTPEYASPEQLRGEEITTVTDVYSLGVVLYQLLTGQPPFASGTASEAITRATSEMVPEKPSSAISRTHQAGQISNGCAEAIRILSAREGSKEKLRKRLAGDLDDIVMMALRSESTRRYASVQQFSEDISCHLQGLTVSASKGSWSYRAGKWIARHTGMAAASAVAAISLVLGVSSILWENHLANQQRERAENRFNDVRKLANSLIFEVNEAMANAPGNTRARKLLLDRAVEYLDKLTQDSAGSPDLQRELAKGYQRLAVVQGSSTESSLGQVSASELSTHKAMQLLEAVARANPKSDQDQLNLAAIHRQIGISDMYGPTGRDEIKKAVAITEGLVQSGNRKLDILSELGMDYGALAIAEDISSDKRQAVERLKESLDLTNEILKRDQNYPRIQEHLAKTQVLLGLQLATTGALEEAKAQIEKGIAGYKVLMLGGRRRILSRDLAASRLRLGWVELMRGNLTGAKENLDSYHRAISSLAKEDPADALLRSDLLDAEFEEGRLLLLNGKTKQAIQQIEHAIDGFAKLNAEGDTGPGNGVMLTWLGEAQLASGQYPAALASYQKALGALKADTSYSDAYTGIATDYVLIGDLQLKSGKLQEAEVSYEKALVDNASSLSLSKEDVAALHPVASAYTGMASVRRAQAENTQSAVGRSRLVREGYEFYQKSRTLYANIPPSRWITSSQFPTLRSERAATEPLPCTRN